MRCTVYGLHNNSQRFVRPFPPVITRRYVCHAAPQQYMRFCVHHVLHNRRQCGEAIVGNAEGQKSFVEDVLALQTKLETMLRQAFFMQVRRLQ
jgi:hypothetical protein